VQRNGSAAWVTDAYPTPLGKRHNYNVKYVVDKRRESFGIPIGGMKPTTLEPAGRKRRGSEGPVESSLLLSISVRPPLAPRPPKVQVAKELNVQQLMQKAHHWLTKGKKGCHPIAAFLKRSSTKSPGYLQGLQAKSLGREVGGKKQLTEEEWGWALEMRMSLDHFEKENKDPKYYPAKDLATAWGVSYRLQSRD
jgi:hypothetical protein